MAPGGTLVACGTAATLDHTGSKVPLLKILVRTWAWNALPNGRRAYLCSIWAGRTLTKRRFRTWLRHDLGKVLQAMADARIAVRRTDGLPAQPSTPRPSAERGEEGAVGPSCAADLHPVPRYGFTVVA